MKDMHSSVSVGSLLPAAAYDADNTPAALDLQGFSACEIVLGIGAGGITFTTNNKVEFKLSHSDDDSDYAAVTVDDILGVESVGTGGIIKSLTAAHATAAFYRFGYIGGKRYLKLLADFSGSHSTPTPLSCAAVRGFAHRGPQADQA